MSVGLKSSFNINIDRKLNENKSQTYYLHYPHFRSELNENNQDDVQEGNEKTDQLFKKIDNKDPNLSLNRYIRKRKSDVYDDVFVFPGYSNKVLTSNWYYPIYSFPKDYDAYNPPGGNYFRSSYNRWGTSEYPMISETKATQESLMNELKKNKPAPRAQFLSQITFSNVNLTEGDKPLSKKAIKYLDPYNTTSQRDFINYYPEEPKMIDRTQIYKPETKYRILLTELTHPRRSGYNKFYDENIEYLNAKRSTEISLPPWALQYDPRRNIKKKEVDENKGTMEKTVSDEPCAKCS